MTCHTVSQYCKQLIIDWHLLIIDQLNVYFNSHRTQIKIQKFGILRYLVLPCIALSKETSRLLKDKGFVFSLFCYIGLLFNMKIVAFCVLKFNHVVFHFLLHLETYTQCSSQEGINWSPVVMNYCGFCLNNLCLPSCTPVYKVITTNAA